MITTDIKRMLQEVIFLSHQSHSEIADALGINRIAVDNMVSKQHLREGLTAKTVSFLEYFGYDIEIKLVKRKEQNKKEPPR